MLSDIASSCEVYLVTGYTDMIKVIDGLATIVQGKLLLDPFSKAYRCYRREDIVNVCIA